ncbi:SMP-30/gluconolactonase/LRE family protein [Sphingomonas nostoxanthinifaciens]|uniref:SMP-30/gluconolactonase/LRE family protein n=1 Tax=Sphingomonas nostoxanthinifaciens TaxID=2872652 RepID=UPI001CC1CA57|nr:SMP-30/gluconolactonase/LRE family protein [Sphingomonas nostoxanthinifaciens]UAK25294.1 SMP-30/gluconolactonase/LRE family protein [Sphingomonas nostoxanthinifaciens]
MRANPIDGFEVDPASLKSIGHDLQRPECILAEPDGTLWSADARGGVVRISADGQQTLIAQGDSVPATAAEQFARIVNETLPNGMAFARNGDILIANFGTDRLELMKRSGESEVLYDNIDGRPLGRVNFVLRDSRDRLWLTVSTRLPDLPRSMTPSVRDGYIALADERGIRIVADGLHFTNEIRFDATEEWLYVVETCGMRVVRFRVGADGTLHGRETYGPENHGRMIDGIAFDSFGNLWGTHIFTDRIFAITPAGDLRIILDDDRDSEAGRQLLQAYAEERITPELMLACGGTVAPWMASVTFGGPDLRDVYIGSLRGTTIPFFRSPVAGAAPVHWNERALEGSR